MRFLPGPLVWLCTLTLLAAVFTTPARAASRAETQAFAAAARLYQDGFHAAAERGFADFVLKFPESARRAEAVLGQVQARYQQANYKGAMELAETQAAQAGGLADGYQYWQAESLFQLKMFPEAAEVYGQLLRDFPLSQLRLEAAVGQAQARARQGDWPGVIRLLQPADGVFQQLARQNPGGETNLVTGILLLGEALLAEKRFPEATLVIEPLAQRALSPELMRQRLDLLCRVLLSAGRLEEALTVSTNLVAAVAGAGSGARAARAGANLMQAEIYEKLNRPADAVLALEKNLDPAAEAPSEVPRQSLFKIVALQLHQNHPVDAIRRLQGFVEQNPKDSALDLVLLTLGELNLKEYYARIELGTTNAASAGAFLGQSQTNLDRLILSYPESSHAGKGYLNRGWCRWAEQKWAEAGRDFEAAAGRLPASEDQAIARFKLADCQFRTGDFAGAIANYNRLLSDYESIERVRNTLFDQALYQLVRANLQTGDLTAAGLAVSRILQSYPNSGYSEKAAQFFGQDLNRRGRPAEARSIYERMLQAAPGSALGPELRLAIARTYAVEGNYPAAIGMYSQWLTNHLDSPLRAEAEYRLAETYFEAGQETNGLSLMTNFVARFPTNFFAYRARNRIADYHFNRGDYIEAERNYQLLYQDPLAPIDLACGARFLAGRAAFLRQEMKDARVYFGDLYGFLTKDTNAPSAFIPETLFALGDTIFGQYQLSTNRAPELFKEAISAFGLITNQYPASPLAARAVGRMGECYLQWASDKNDPGTLVLAAACFSNVVSSTHADLAARSQAQVGLGKVAERSGDPDTALQKYLDLIYNIDGSDFDPVWVKEAGIAAGQICEASGRRDQAAKLYRRLAELLPALRPILDEKIGRVAQEPKKSAL